MAEPIIRLKKYAESLTPCHIGDIYIESKERGDDSLPMLTVSIHSGESDGELEEEQLGKRVARSEDKTKYKRAESNDIVFNMMRAWQGAIGVVRTTGMASPAYIVATPNDKVFPLYMDYYMKTPQMINKINRFSYGLMDFRKRLYWDSFVTIDCFLPSVAEQKEIVALFESVESVISTIQSSIDLWNEKKKAVMQNIFLQVVRFKDSNGEEYPSWEETIISEIANVCKRKQLDKNDIVENGQFYHLNGGTTPSNRTNISNAPANTISISEGGNSCGFVNWNSEPFFSGGHNYTLQDIREDVFPEYLFQYLKYKEDRLMALRVGSGLPNIQIKAVSTFAVQLPSYEEQKKIGECLLEIDNVILLKKKKLETWQNIKKGLLQQMFV